MHCPNILCKNKRIKTTVYKNYQRDTAYAEGEYGCILIFLDCKKCKKQFEITIIPEEFIES